MTSLPSDRLDETVLSVGDCSAVHHIVRARLPSGLTDRKSRRRIPAWRCLFLRPKSPVSRTAADRHMCVVGEASVYSRKPLRSRLNRGLKRRCAV